MYGKQIYFREEWLTDDEDSWLEAAAGEGRTLCLDHCRPRPHHQGFNNNFSVFGQLFNVKCTFCKIFS